MRRSPISAPCSAALPERTRASRSSTGCGPLPRSSRSRAAGDERLELVEAGAPAHVVVVALLDIGEDALDQAKARAAGRRLEAQFDHRLVPAAAVGLLPTPGHDQAFRRRYLAIDAG